FSCSRALLLLCAAVPTFVQSAYSQSTDQVHVAPHVTPGEMRPQGTVPKETDSTLRRARPIRADVDLVLVPVTVTDAMNRSVTGLQKQDFTVFEGNEQQQIRYFSAEEPPISVGLLLDTSKSMANKFVTERVAVEEFFKNAN